MASIETRNCHWCIYSSTEGSNEDPSNILFTWTEDEHKTFISTNTMTSWPSGNSGVKTISVPEGCKSVFVVMCNGAVVQTCWNEWNAVEWCIPTACAVADECKTQCTTEGCQPILSECNCGICAPCKTKSAWVNTMKVKPIYICRLSIGKPHTYQNKCFGKDANITWKGSDPMNYIPFLTIRRHTIAGMGTWKETPPKPFSLTIKHTQTSTDVTAE